jgi:thymidylate kinase
MFVAVVGLDGTGKTTLAKNLVLMLNAAGHNALYVHDPDSTPFGKALRLMGRSIRSHFALALAHAGARRELCETMIQPHLNAGGVVIADRFSPCYFAYHIDAVPLKYLLCFDGLARNGLKPNFIIQPLASYFTARQRKAHEPDFMSREEYDRIAENYAAQRKGRKATLTEWLTIDTDVQTASYAATNALSFIDHLFLSKQKPKELLLN